MGGGRHSDGPFLLPARLLLLISGALAVGLAAFNLYHEQHAGLVDAVYTDVALTAGVIWLAALITAYAGWRISIFIAALVAFIEFGLILSSHFVAGPGAISTFVKREGLPVATVDMALVPLCLLIVMSAAASWTQPRGRHRRLDMAPLLIAAVAGSVLVILQATDDLHRVDFGSANPEDGAFAAAVLASAWLAGGLWIARVRRTGAALITFSTLVVCYSFATIHLAKGGTSISQIASQSGAVWAIAAAGAVILAGASLVTAIAMVIVSMVRKQPENAVLPRPARRGA